MSDSWWLTFDLFLQMPWVIRSAARSRCYLLPSLPQSCVQVFKPLSHGMTVSVDSVLQHEGWIRTAGWDSASEGVPTAIFSQVMTPCELKTLIGRCEEMLSDSQQWGSSCLSHRRAQLFHTFKVYDGYIFFVVVVGCIVTMETTEREAIKNVLDFFFSVSNTSKWLIQQIRWDESKSQKHCCDDAKYVILVFVVSTAHITCVSLEL